MKILIIIPHFGHWPKWIQYFFQSCKANPAFSWLIYTDCPILQSVPVNVRILNKSLEDFSHLASRKLDLQIMVRNPYKICDLRPAFGKIFEDFIEDYDFWGYSDLDLIYGNLDQFLSSKVLQQYDVISVREQYMTGHFALLKNNDYINTLFKTSREYSKIFQDESHHFAFDERSNFYGRRLFSSENYPWFKSLHSKSELFFNKLRFKVFGGRNGELIDFTRITKNEAKHNRIKLFRRDLVKSDLWFKKKNIQNWTIKWESGRLIDKTENKELLHFHLINSKKNPNFLVTNWLENKQFVITEKGITIPN